ncbi:MAG: peptidase S10 [Allobranchiibius sp.]
MAESAPSSKTPPEPPTELLDQLTQTSHTLQLPDGPLQYTATSGRVVLREESIEEGTWKGSVAKAQVAITAYTLDGADPHTRPVTFAFNGGPGSASIWLHLGLLGPRRVIAGDVGALAAPPYDLVDNTETLLAHSDLVFIDPVSTGRSRVVEGTKPKDFHGFKRDLETVAEVIRRWVTSEGRWMSPKFLAGESYGTTRAAGLAQLLQDDLGMHLNGLMLISSVLDFGTSDFEGHDPRGWAMYLPFYAATAHAHGKHPGRSLPEVLADAEQYASREYPWVLSRGNRLSSQDRADAVRRLAELTGLSEDYVDRADLRIEHWRYFGELLRDQGLTVGRLDSRFTGPAASRIAEHMDADPSMDAIIGAYVAAYQHYAHAELGNTDDAPFSVFGKNVIEEWSYKEFEGRSVYVSDRLERAMRANPHLRIHIAYGYYDGATPYFAAQETVAQLRLSDEALARIEHCYYPAGHMMYVHQPSRVQQSRDLAAFVRRATGG